MCDWAVGSRDGYITISDETAQVIDGEDSLHCYGFRPSRWKTILFHICSVLLLGAPYLVLHWYCQYLVQCKYSKCPLREADVILIKDSHGDHFVETVATALFSWPGSRVVQQVRSFCHLHVKYVWTETTGNFQRLCGLDGETAMLLENCSGFTVEEQKQMSQLYGPNTINVEVKSYWQLFVEEVFNPFYVFQAFSVILWSLDDYYVYAGCVVFLSAVSIITALVQTRKQSVTLKDLVTASNTNKVIVVRKGKDGEEIPASHLVPGDVISIPAHGCLMVCDALLLSGNCIVNESMLTGESVPVTKTPPSPSKEQYNPSTHKRHTLFCGTSVIQTRFYGNNQVLAVVVRTGFSTAKGELVRSILHPRPVGFRFYSDSVKFVLVLFCVAAVGMVYSVYLYLLRGSSVGTILLRTLDIVTIVVPPALPAAMTAGTVYSQNRLRKLGIFCISPPRINICGKVKLVCFDKTGTLTEEGLDVCGVLPAGAIDLVPDPSTLHPKSPLLAAMASCHSLTRIDGHLTGDPLDLEMFTATHWELMEPGTDTSRYDMLAPTVVRPAPDSLPEEDRGNGDWVATGEGKVPFEIGIVRQFPFSSTAQRMSVIARTLGADHMTLYAKGAPERIMELCDPKTVPSNVEPLLLRLASEGYRVLALASRELEPRFTWRQAQRVTREQVETDLTFLGLLVMQNTLKPETTPAIAQLQQAKLRCVMVTGDNLLTAVSVARECGMIGAGEGVRWVRGSPAEGPQLARLWLEPVGVVPSVTNGPLAVDGRSWAILRAHFPQLVPLVAARGAVFARMGPDQKAQLVEVLQSLDYVVAMCGDGANDCGALRAADVGVSLSEAEASVAAPFTSRVANITCVLQLIREGRCALVTSFAVFKYMALYSLIQFITVLILYSQGTLLGNMEFLYVDLVITTSLAVVMGRTGPTSSLVATRPLGSLVSGRNVVPLVLQVCLTAVVQGAALVFLTQQEWFEPLNANADNEVVTCWENSAVYCVSCYQYLILAVVYSKGRPHRKPLYTNVLFLLTLLSLTAFTTFLLVYPIEPVADFFELVPYSGQWDIFSFRLCLLLLPTVHLLGALVIEVCVADARWLPHLLHWLTDKQEPKNRYKRIELELAGDAEWLISASA